MPLNNRFIEIILKECKFEINNLNKDLESILAKGFTKINDCNFLASLHELQNHMSLDNFEDKTGYEVFVNSVHIDDYVKSDYFEQSILFLSQLINKWKSYNSLDKLKILVTETEFGYNIKFHTERENEMWFNEEGINNITEGILIFNT